MASLQRDINADTISAGKALVIPHKSISSSVSTPGTLAYDPTGKAVIYCDGTAWFLIGGTSVPIVTTDNAIARFNGTAGTVQNSLASISDAGELTAPSLKTDTIVESTAAAGVTIDGVLLKDSGVNFGGTTLGSYIQATFTGGALQQSNIGANLAASNGHYTRIGNVVHFSITLTGTPSVGATATGITFDFPVTPANAMSRCVGSGVNPVSKTQASVRNDAASPSRVVVDWISDGTALETIHVFGTYLLL